MLTGLTAFWIVISNSAALQPPVAGLEPAGVVEVVGVIDARTLELSGGGTLRLSGIQSPESVADAAHQILRDMAAGQPVSLFYGETRSDRWRRAVGHVVLSDRTWVQAALLRRGLARVYSFPDNRAGVPEMLAIEAEARIAARGLWGDWKNAVKSTQELPRFMNSFQIVEGTVVEAANVRGRVYLNFGADWKTDFTVLVPPRVRRQFDRKDVDLSTLQGVRLRVRGWVKRWNGPMIELTHAEQLEIPDAP